MLIEQIVDGKLTTSGSIEPLTQKNLTAFLYLKGTVTLTELTVLIINRSISFVGNLTNNIGMTKNGLLTLKGNITKKAMLIIYGETTFKREHDRVINPIVSIVRRATNWMRRGHH